MAQDSALEGFPPLQADPKSARGAWIAPSADVMGQVTLGEDVSIWYQSVLRADLMPISIGDRTNIQDGSILHVDYGKPLTIGKDVVVGHHVNLHGCTIEDLVLVGIGAIVLSGAVVRRGAVVAAGAVVMEGQEIPENSLAVGIPAKVIKVLPETRHDAQREHCRRYMALANAHREKIKAP